MQCYTELTAPTAVTHSITLPFLSADSNNLVVSKGSLLQIFRTKTIRAEFDNALRQPSPPAPSATPAPIVGFENRRSDDDGIESNLLAEGIHRVDRGNNTKLVLVAEYPLSGTVCGLAAVNIKSSKSGGHALLVALRNAKACLTEWDPDTQTITNTSVHYYENEDGASFDLPLSEYETVLQADPSSRCAALKFGSRSIAILPFKQASTDIEMDDWDADLDGPRPVAEVPTASGEDADKTADSSDARGLPYSESFVLRFPQLDPTLLFPQHFAFLHEYRDPTFGILSSTQQPAYYLGRKDHMSYKVFTLDLTQRASTTILAVDNLPHDLHRVIPLPAPVGGALLLGDNELIHIDQSGRANGVGVNSFAKTCSSFPLADQSSLELALEHCAIEQLSAETGELLMILNTGRLAVISFKIDGRTVTGISVKLVPLEIGGGIIPSRASCVTKVDKHVVFVGSATSDSFVVGWTRRHTQTARRRSRLADASLEYELDDLDIEDEDDDDLYGDSGTLSTNTNGVNGQAKDGDMVFRVHDTLLSIAPIRELTSGRAAFFPDSEEERNSKGVVSPLQLTCAVGRGNAGAIAVLNKDIQPKVIGRFEFPEARGFWTMSVQKPIPKALQAEKDVTAAIGNDYGAAAAFDKFMIVAKVDLDGYETSDVYALTAAGFEALTGTEFDPAAGFTVEAGAMGNHKRVIQVLKSEVRCYDGDLGLSQIVPMLDEETGTEPRVVKASIADPYLLLIRDDSSVWLGQIDSNMELEEMERGDEKLLSNKWSSGCLFADRDNHFTLSKKTGESPVILAFLVNTVGALYIYELSDLSKPIYVAEGLAYLPPALSPDLTARRGTPKESITEILVADLGDTTYKSPYLIVRNSTDDLTIYEPILKSSQKNLGEALHFKKLKNPVLASTPEAPNDDDTTPQETRFVSLRACANVGGYATVFLPGTSPSFLIKSSKSTPKVIGLQGLGVRGLSSFHTEGCERGFIYADSAGVARVTQLPSRTNLAESGVSVRKIPLGVNVKHIAYHTKMETYAVGCSVLEPFELPKDDEHHKDWARENIGLKPMVGRGQVKLINPINWSVIQTVEFEPYEDVLCLKALNLEVSEVTKERRQLIVVGTGTRKGEDLPIRGRIYVYDVVLVIPEAGKPETNKRLKLIAKEDIPRGAVTAVSEIGTQGLMLVAQGQKCMVRGLKEDGSLLPVAFMDMNCYVTAAKELRGSGLCVMADATKGVWFTGCTEEPYKMQLFGKSATHLEVVTADFLPDGKNLFVIATDTSGDIHVLQYDPEHPKSLQGHLLLQKTTFCTASNGPTTALLLPRITPKDGPPEQAESQNHVLLLGSESGMLATVVPLPEASYRRLLSLVAQLVTALPTACGTNPKAYRTPHPYAAAVGVDGSSGRAMVDGAVLARWGELGTGRRGEMVGRTGYGGAEQVRGELDSLLGWKGIGYY
ncbi:related to pre-mRNA 3`-end processing factor CF II [Cephalotrichum gorgonifer]|uniref:Protein CFT1 n=1 Tax=Cephalotrichum gorgonifer TaxID=2041049 RepID=A0AAE8MZU1_9PEZI|nr:related to pre-mRNA 3`-end processing factor CF II [Cephalotrichum gorgonifer]